LFAVTFAARTNGVVGDRFRGDEPERALPCYMPVSEPLDDEIRRLSGTTGSVWRASCGERVRATTGRAGATAESRPDDRTGDPDVRGWA